VCLISPQCIECSSKLCFMSAPRAPPGIERTLSLCKLSLCPCHGC
jgi:hypothetical protein